MTSWVPLLALLVSSSVGIYQIRRWWQDGQSARKAQLLAESAADEKRGAIVVDSAERAVQVLEAALSYANGEVVRLRQELADCRTELARLRREIDQLRASS